MQAHLRPPAVPAVLTAFPVLDLTSPGRGLHVTSNLCFSVPPLTTPPPGWHSSACPLYVRLCFCFVRLFILSQVSVKSWGVCLCLTSYTWQDTPEVHPSCCKRRASLLFMAVVLFRCTNAPHFYLLRYSWTLGLLPYN